MVSNTEVKEWYNQFSERQKKVGVNLRHYTIMNFLKEAGLNSKSHVLEIGCGIGQLTSLLKKRVKHGKIVATDISDTGVELARQATGNSDRIDFIVTDMQDFSYDMLFDFIILPDVLEHIPVEQHHNLFSILVRHMHDKSVICINIPHPKALDFHRKYRPEILQVIDQSLSALKLLEDAYAHGLVLHTYLPHSLFHEEPDYVFIKLVRAGEIQMNTRGRWAIIFSKLTERLKFILN